MRSKTLRLVRVCFAAAVLVAACATTVVIPEDLTAAELVQRGQEASDRNRYNNALQYYQAVLERFPYNAEFVCTAEYEIAFIFYKQKKYELSKLWFNALLERYNSPDGELLPPQFRVLARKKLQTIDERENRTT